MKILVNYNFFLKKYAFLINNTAYSLLNNNESKIAIKLIYARTKISHRPKLGRYCGK